MRWRETIELEAAPETGREGGGGGICEEVERRFFCFGAWVLRDGYGNRVGLAGSLFTNARTN